MPVITRRGGKPASKSKTVKRTGATAPQRRSASAAQKTASRKAVARESKRTNRSSTTDIPEKQLQRILDKLAEAAELRTELFEAHREAVDASNRLILDAEAQGVPVHMIVENAQIARQQFYKLLGDAASGKLANGRQPAGRKPASNGAKAAPKASAPKRQIARKGPAVQSGTRRTLKRKG